MLVTQLQARMAGEALSDVCSYALLLKLEFGGDFGYSAPISSSVILEACEGVQQVVSLSLLGLCATRASISL